MYVTYSMCVYNVLENLSSYLCFIFIVFDFIISISKYLFILFEWFIASMNAKLKLVKNGNCLQTVNQFAYFLVIRPKTVQPFGQKMIVSLNLSPHDCKYARYLMQSNKLKYICSSSHISCVLCRSHLLYFTLSNKCNDRND